MDLPLINTSTSAAFYRWQPACWLRVFGPDAATFLQGQFTNDLRLLGSQSAVYGLWLSLKGKVVGDSFVLQGPQPDSFWIGSYASPASVIRERLESHVIADDVMIEDHTNGWRGVSVFGDAAAGMAARTGGNGVVFPGRRAQSGQLEWVYPETAAAGADELVRGWTELDAQAVARIRINDGIPAVPQDIGPADLPNEAGLDRDAISYTKGCYLGQEVMARLKSMGQVRRRLVRVRARGAMPPLPAALFSGERPVGELRSVASESAAELIGLAMVSRLNVTGADELALAANVAPTVRLLEAP